MVALRDKIRKQIETATKKPAVKNNLSKYKKDVDNIAKQVNALVDRYVSDTNADWSMAKMDIQNAILDAQSKLTK